jgi:hypothetical protein
MNKQFYYRTKINYSEKNKVSAVCGRYGASVRGAKPVANKIDARFDGDGGGGLTRAAITPWTLMRQPPKPNSPTHMLLQSCCAKL